MVNLDEYKDKIELREQPNAMKLYLNLNYLKDEQRLVVWFPMDR